jgi:ATP-dependent DNA helicase RecG
MTIDELRRRLAQIEWRDIEFKRAQGSVPRSSYETVSAFANTGGGYLIFGVEENNRKFEIVGVLDPEKIQSDFLSALRGGQLLSCVIAAEESRVEDHGKVVLAFFIPEARREQKPVHLNGELRKSYIRRAGGDERCTEEELKRFIRDADSRSFDGEVLLELDCAVCFDLESLSWYRKIFNLRNPAHETESQSDFDFLHHFGLIVTDGASRRPTRAAVLLFGNASAMQKTIARPVVDVRLLLTSANEALPEERWDHRMLLEENLTKCWRRGVEFFMDRIADRPFRLDANTLHGSDASPDYLAFREAFLNLLTHQDFGDQSRMAVISVHRDQLVFFNPGASHVSGEELFNPGAKPVRNPRLRSMLQRVGIGEQAGTGLKTIYGSQRRLGRIPPSVNNNWSDQSFEVTIAKRLISDQYENWWSQRIGVNLSDVEAALFIHALRQGAIGPLEAASVAGLSHSDTRRILERLVQQQLLDLITFRAGASYRPKPIFQERAPELLGQSEVNQPLAMSPAEESASLVTKRNDQAPFGLPDKAIIILEFCRVGRGVPAIMDRVAARHRSFFKKNHLDSLVKAGFLRQTHPDKPRHPEQGYVTTEEGKKAVEFLSNTIRNPPSDDLVTESDQATDSKQEK